MHRPSHLTLTAKTLLCVIAASLAAFVVITAATVWQESERLHERAHAQAQRTVQQNLPALSEDLWNFNNASLRALLVGMVGDGPIVQAELRPDSGVPLTVSRSGPLPPIDRSWSVPIASPQARDGGDTRLGEIRVHESYATLRPQQIESAWRIAVAQLLQIATMAMVLVLIVRWLITRRLARLAAGVAQLHPLDPSARITLPHRRLLAQYDELDALVETLNRLHADRAEEASLRAQAQAALGARVREIETTLEALSDGVLALRPDGSVLYGNDTVARLLGRETDTLPGQHWTTLFTLTDEDRAAVQNHWLEQALLAGAQRHLRGGLRVAPRAAPSFIAELNAVPLPQPGDATMLLVLRDISTEIDQERQIAYQAFHDPLTGLGNRTKLARDLPHDLAAAQAAGERLALLFIDLDNFKDINDTLGHQTGDMLLQELALRLRACIHQPAWITRHGGDEFLVVLPHLGDESRAVDLAQTLMATIRRPFALSGYELHVTPSVGISVFPDHGHTPAELVSRADMAMYAAKKLGRNAHCVFDEQQLQESSHRLSMENGLRTALARRELWLAYQTKVALDTGAVVGVEALLRWENPVLGAVSPGRFIPVAEESGLIIDIGDWVLHEAVAAARRWRTALGRDLPVAVNIAAAQFRSPRLLETLREVARQAPDMTRLLQLEVTESALISGLDDVSGKFAAIRELGYSIAIDDFGTGYSSLSYLKRLPVDTLKIDQSFIRDLHSSPQDVTIVSSVVRLGQSLGFKIVAEGVEEARHVQILADLGCDQGQGYHFSRPVPEAQLLASLRGAATTPISPASAAGSATR